MDSVEMLLCAKQVAHEYLAYNPDSGEYFAALHDKFYEKLWEELGHPTQLPLPPPPPWDDAAQAIAA